MFNDLLELDLGNVEPSVAGPRRPQDRVALGDVCRAFRTAYAAKFEGAAASRTTSRTTWSGSRARAGRPPATWRR